MKKFLSLIGALSLFYGCQNQTSQTIPSLRFEISKGLQSADYNEGMAFWEALSQVYSDLQLEHFGSTDQGIPLSLVSWKGKGKGEKVRILINNAIHPGEPDGVDASMIFMRDLLANDSLQKAWGNLEIAIIPYYNIGGALNRNSHSRANQEGPEEYGFRGNARNFDLNRDFIKMDSKNMWAFAEIFHQVNPHVFLDNHVSNGADYQYTMTYLATQEDKLGGPLGEFMRETFNPGLEQKMAARSQAMVPYVNVWGSTPQEQGINQFFDSPRYSSGYAALFHCIAYVPETHMLKPFADRVQATLDLMISTCALAQEQQEEILGQFEAQKDFWRNQKTYPLAYRPDWEQADSIDFFGYQHSHIPSDVHGGLRLFYDREDPKTYRIAFRNKFIPEKFIDIPQGYIIPRGQHEVIDRLMANGIEVYPFSRDTTLLISQFRVVDYQTVKTPYEGHYVHYNAEVVKLEKQKSFLAGDFWVPSQQAGIRYILEVLEPRAMDSFFNWNFFDSYLQQKEHFSAYVFEEKAKQILASDAALRKAFEEEKQKHPEWKDQGYLALEWIYRHSNHYEESHMNIPVYRLEF